MNKIIVTLTLCISIILTGCQGTGRASSRNVDPALTKSNTAKFFSKSAWQSCAIGAGLGGIGCVLAGGKTGVCLASAAVGCGVLMGANYYLDSKRAEYADDEMRLDVYIQDVQKNTYEVQAVTETAKAVLDKNLATLKVLNNQIKNDTINKKQAQNDLTQIDANIAYLRDKLKRMKKVENDWVSISSEERQSGVRVSRLDQQISQLHKQIAVLENQINLVTKQRSAVKVS
ncbi:hypothetical protein [Gilliamella sp. App6-5]|uniref:hypothetical protein n=1 Tax=Gilliamella sp. App6-5 TaxID=3120232 RepID=UPI0009C046D6|nr:hypothetical protein [Gilliamella apicola]